jgi:hypothetical protein
LREFFGIDNFSAASYAGKPKILFIGFGESTHTHSWIDLLANTDFNVRLFALPSGIPPADWQVPTYVSACTDARLDSRLRARLFPRRSLRFARRSQPLLTIGRDYGEVLAMRWLARIIRGWRPDIIHTLGLDPAGNFYFATRNQFGLDRIGKWVLQTRGGSDLALTHLNPALRETIGEVLRQCDQLVSDNPVNFQIARELGVRENQLSVIGTVPGTGGVDVAALDDRSRAMPSQRRIILLPKAYEAPWSKVLPVFEALKLCWERIQPCEIYMLSMNAEAKMWFWALPEEIIQRCHPSERLPRMRVLELMTHARVMLAPSLVDGTPNSMFEAMAGGAFPIVSPLDTIRPVVEDERNVLFARNLYPQEIAAALTLAMTDDALVDRAAESNLTLVRRIANRADIRARVLKFYEWLAQQPVRVPGQNRSRLGL